MIYGCKYKLKLKSLVTYQSITRASRERKTALKQKENRRASIIYLLENFL